MVLALGFHLIVSLAYQSGFILRYREGFNRMNSIGRIEEVDSRNGPRPTNFFLTWMPPLVLW